MAPVYPRANLSNPVTSVPRSPDLRPPVLSKLFLSFSWSGSKAIRSKNQDLPEEQQISSAEAMKPDRRT